MTKQQTRDLILWIAVLAGPIVWLASFEAKFAWVPQACASQNRSWLLLISLLAFLLTATVGFLARRQWKQLENASPNESGSPLSRSRLMAVGGMAFSAGFCLVILAQVIPDLIFGICQ